VKTKLLAPLFLLGLFLGGCTVRHETPDLRGQDVRLTIFHTADIHSRLLPYNFAPGRNDQDLGLDPDACKAWACGDIASATDDEETRRSTLRTGCRRIEIGADKVAEVAERAGLSGPDKVTCELLTTRYSKLCRASSFPGACVSDGAGGFVTWDCTCNYGGIGRIATVLRTERASAGRSLHLDSGDCFQGAPIFNLFGGEVEFRTLSWLGLDAAALGNHEFDKGAKNLANQIVNWASFPVLAANYEFEEPNDFSGPWLGTVVEPYTIFNVDGLRVGVIGMGNLSSLQGIYEAGNSLGVRPLNTDEVVRYYVNLVRPQVDLLVIVSHLGLDEDEGVAVNEIIGGGSGEQNEEAALAGVDVILGGHLHIALNPPKLIPQRDANGNPTGFNTVLVHSGAFAKFVGRLDLVVHVGQPGSSDDDDRRSHVKSYTYDLIPIDARIASDGDMLRDLEPYETKLNQSFDLTKTFAFVGTADGAKIFRNDASGGDSQIGNLVTLSMRVRKRVEADFALTNSLGVRADFEYGALTLEQMYNVFPFENSITTMFLSGGEVREMLDFVARKSADRGCRTQAQVSGIAFDMVCRRPSGCADPTLPKSCATAEDCGDPDYVFCNESGACRKKAACADAIFIGDGCNVCDPARPESSCCNRPELGLPCKCQPLNPYGTYKVAVNDYIAAGGSGFLVLKRNTTKFNTGIQLRDALVDYLRALPSRCPERIADWNITIPVGQRPLATDLACIDTSVEPHDGRITPVLE
jgi:5'-nucleotidase/UDP-sugar diphosphatase